MVKQVSFILIIFMLSLTFISAQTNSVTELVNPGITPDSALYFLDLAAENIGLALTFDNNAKIEKELNNAEERLSEAREMALENNLDAMAKAEEKHREILTKIKSELAGINSDNSTEELKKELQIEEKINAHEIKVKNVKNEIKIEIKIKGKITPEQQILLDSLIASFEGQTREVSVKINDEKKDTKERIKEETGREGEDVENELRKELEIEDDNKIEVEVENGLVKVKVEINDTMQEFEFEVNSSQTQEQIKEEIANEIAKRLSMSEQEVKKMTEEIEIEDEEKEAPEAPETPEDNLGASEGKEGPEDSKRSEGE